MQLDLEILNLFIKVDDFSIKDLREILDLLGLEVKHIDGKILTIETLANRGDHLSHVNIAKELALALGLEVRPVKVGTRLDFFEPSKSPSLLIDNISELTLSFAICHIRCKPFKNHKVKLKTARRDFNFKNPLVTISNYVTTEIGQPLHCYSAKKVKPPFYTKQTEICRFQALDAQIYSFPEHTITVFDSTNRPVAIGGIIGSYDSCLDDDDWEIYLESACFDPVQIRKSRTAAGINTEASFYFERGVAFDIQKIAIERFLEILEENHIDFEVLAFEMKNKRINSRKILLNKEIISKHLGFPVEPRDCSRILSELDFKILSEDNIGFEVEVPPKRYFNVYIQEDLVQDLARFIGFNKIPKSCLKFEVSPPSVNPLFDCSNRLRHFAICHGFHEVMTRVFISPKERDTLSQLNKDDTWVNLLNSCTTQYSYLRNSLLFNLIKAVVRNLDNFVPVIKIFEIGTVFLRNGVEQVHFAFALTVPHVELNYLHGDSQPSLDFMVNFYQACLKILLRDKLPTFQKTKNRYLDFGFEVLLEGSRIGCLGAVSPSLLATLDSKLPIMYGEIYLNSVLRFESQFDNLLVQAGIPPRAISVNEMPPSYRDLTIPCHDLPVGEIIRLLKSNFEDVAGILVVDRLCGKNVTLRIYFKGREKPLTKEQVDSSFERIRLFIEQAA